MRDNYMTDERLTRERSVLNAGVGYHSKAWSVQLSAYNVPHHRYCMRTTDYSSLLPSVAYAYTDGRMTIMLRATMNISWERHQRRTERLQDSAEPVDNGIMKATRH